MQLFSVSQALSGSVVYPILSVLLWAVTIAVIAAMSGFLYVVFREVARSYESKKQAAEGVNRAEREVRENPGDTKLAWDLARKTLDEYFTRNLEQVRLIFYVAVAVMVAGFALIAYGAFLAVSHIDGKLPAMLTALSGIITEFISVTFMVVYKSTLQQASGYMTILEKINTVGMAVQIIETVPKEDPEYSRTRTVMAKMLLEQFKTHPHEPPAATGAKSARAKNLKAATRP